MSRDFEPFIRDILKSCERILRFVGEMSYEDFIADDKTYDATLRNLAIIGEAVKQIPESTRSEYPTVEWRRIARFRDIVIHHYFGIDNSIVWDIVQNKVPELFELLSQRQQP